MTQDSMMASKKIIVVVEDDDLLRSLMVDAIRELNFEVVEFATADDALIYAMGASVDIGLVVADLTVPGQLDGAELAEMLAGRYPHIPFILTTGYIDAHRKLSSQIHFLPKPWALVQLTGAVLKAI
ncbi:response regulator [Pseudomonas sp. UBA6562]|uniref:response regulator n=1 Tax=Pseudomonas sp. UBA6562 TaxID=1947332 RepID=UPI0025DB4A84|nr:response regulator [Pseudomonas sp. UBA6562]